MTQQNKIRLYQVLVPVVASLIGGLSVVHLNPYTTIMADRDRAEMREWVIDYVQTHSTQPDVALKLDILFDQMRSLQESISEIRGHINTLLHERREQRS